MIIKINNQEILLESGHVSTLLHAYDREARICCDIIGRQVYGSDRYVEGINRVEKLLEICKAMGADPHKIENLLQQAIVHAEERQP